MYENSDRRILHSEITKKLWKNESYRQRQKHAIRRPVNYSDPKLRSLLSDAARKFWGNRELVEEYLARRSSSVWKKKHSDSVKEKWSDDSYRKRKSDETEALWKTDSYRNKHRAIWSDPDRLKAQSNKIKAVWADPSYRSKMASARSKFCKGRRSSLEVVTSELLSLMNIKFVGHKVFGPYTFDFFLPEHNVIIESQGEYWHSLPNAKRNDAAKNTYISRYFPGLRILYLHEKDYLNPLSVRQKIVSFLIGPDVPDPIEFSLSDVYVRPVDMSIRIRKSRMSIPEVFLNSYHYGQYGRAAKTVIGAFIGQDLIAVGKFSGVVRKEVATSMGLLTKNVVELDRFCIHPRYHKKNFASWFLSRCSRLVFSTFPSILAIVSFADTTYGHDGTIYRASNWKFVSIVPPDYYYVDETGWVMHKKTLFDHAKKMGKKELEYAAKHGYVKIFGKEKKKFILFRSNV